VRLCEGRWDARGQAGTMESGWRQGAVAKAEVDVAAEAEVGSGVWIVVQAPKHQE
jgi:hypothetical protein